MLAFKGPTGCGAVISEAVANQTHMLSEVTGMPIEELDFKFNLWVEALGMYVSTPRGGVLSEEVAGSFLY